MSYLRTAHFTLLGFGLFLFGASMMGVTYGLPPALVKNSVLTWKAFEWAALTGTVVGLIDVAMQLEWGKAVRRSLSEALQTAAMYARPASSLRFFTRSGLRDSQALLRMRPASGAEIAVTL